MPQGVCQFKGGLPENNEVLHLDLCLPAFMMEGMKTKHFDKVFKLSQCTIMCIGGIFKAN